jgi:hypothetical protein
MWSGLLAVNGPHGVRCLYLARPSGKQLLAARRYPEEIDALTRARVELAKAELLTAGLLNGMPQGYCRPACG